MEKLYEMLKATGLPAAYLEFKKKVTPPFVVYVADSSEDFYADNTNYQGGTNYQIELYTKAKDKKTEQKITNILKQNKITYTKIETWIAEEKLYQVVFYIRMMEE